MSILKRTEFGNPILRNKAARVPVADIGSKEIQDLIADMKQTLIDKKLGIGLAAPQVGRSLQISVVAIRPSEYRPSIKSFDLVLINPQIIAYEGSAKPIFEGCISSGSGGVANLFGKAVRYPKVKVRFYDQAGKRHERTFSDLKAQVVQHEVDHLNGILFVDRVEDSKTYITFNEYIKRVKAYLKEHPEMR